MKDHVYALELSRHGCSRASTASKSKPKLELSIVHSSIGNNDDLTKRMMRIEYDEETVRNVPASLHSWRLARDDCNDWVVRPETKLPGKVRRVFLSEECVEVEWLIASRDAQRVFVWLGIGSVADNKQLRYTVGAWKQLVRNELCLVSLECNDRVCRGMDWDEKLFGKQDAGKLLGKVSQIKTSPKGGYEVLVQWDHGKEHNYRYGLSSLFDVELVQRHRRDPFVPLFCGDRVVRAKHWDAKFAQQDAALVDAKRKRLTPQVVIVRELHILGDATPRTQSRCASTFSKRPSKQHQKTTPFAASTGWPTPTRTRRRGPRWMRSASTNSSRARRKSTALGSRAPST